MKEALGLVEIRGMSTAIEVADTMVKAANVRIIEMENTRGIGYMTIKVAGDVGAVNAAVDAGKKTGILYDKLISAKVIPRPADGMAKVFCKEKDLIKKDKPTMNLVIQTEKEKVQTVKPQEIPPQAEPIETEIKQDNPGE